MNIKIATNIAIKNDQRHNQTLSVTTKKLHMTTLTKLERLKQQRDALDKSINEMLTAQAEAETKLRNRRCIILGAWLMENNPAQVAKIVASLTRTQDRNAFKGFSLPNIDASQLAATATAQPESPPTSPAQPQPIPQTAGA
jgi:hypothetical protein